MRRMRFCIVFSMGSRFSGLGSFWVSFGVSQEPLLEPGGPTWTSVGALGGFLGVLGGFLGGLGSLEGPIWASVG